ncbi:DNA-directed RNA polymerase II subunit RPB2 [Acorus calamus]|uniref:DNA-directed RNA polymerase n=1 Tax=Acorus calamus TaxID=4465 RepID=A0AAV9DZ44_ACOCL|nr:DNA-directed RNA polymerase II subunit RPB2 [Acorus calamus]
MGVLQQGSSKQKTFEKKCLFDLVSPFLPASPDVSMDFLAAPIKSSVDKFRLLPEFLKVRGLVKQHLDSFNYFVDQGMKKIMCANDRVVCSFDPSYYLKYTNIYVGEPSVMVDFKPEILTPQECRLRDLTYAAPIYVDVEYSIGSQSHKSIEKKERVLIGRMPIMLRSRLCTLNGKDEAELAKLGECPLDPGGYFVVKGAEKGELVSLSLKILNPESPSLNSNEGIMASVTSSTAETKTKTIIFMEKEKIYLQLNQLKKKVPIVVIMKAMGMESDQEIVQMIGMCNDENIYATSGFGISRRNGSGPENGNSMMLPKVSSPNCMVGGANKVDMSEKQGIEKMVIVSLVDSDALRLGLGSLLVLNRIGWSCGNLVLSLVFLPHRDLKDALRLGLGSLLDLIGGKTIRKERRGIGIEEITSSRSNQINALAVLASVIGPTLSTAKPASGSTIRTPGSPERSPGHPCARTPRAPRGNPSPHRPSLLRFIDLESFIKA